MASGHWVITVVDRYNRWHNSTAKALVREMGASPKLAAEWGKIRRSMSPAGLKRKAKECRN